MKTEKVRKGYTQAIYNEKNSKIYYGQLLIISIAIGAYHKSWWIFGGIFFGLLFAQVFKPLSILIGITLSLGWAVIGFAIGSLFDSFAAATILGIFALLAGIGINFSGMEWGNDVGDN